MRARHAIAVVAVILAGAGANLTFFSTPNAEAGWRSSKNVGLDVSQLHQNVTNLPMQKFHDMSFVFTDDVLTASDRQTRDALNQQPEYPPKVAGLDNVRKGWFTPRCAERDLRASAAIEEFSRLEEMPSAWLAQAGLTWLHARGYCLSGAETEGVKLYDKISAGEARLPNDD